MESSTVMCWMSPFIILVLLLLFYFCWKILSANNVDPDQMPHYVVSDLGLHFANSLLGVSREQRVNNIYSLSLDLLALFQSDHRLPRPTSILWQAVGSILETRAGISYDNN